MSDYAVTKMSGVVGGIEDLKSHAEKELQDLESSTVQLTEAAGVINNFVNEVFQAINGMEDTEDINKQLILGVTEMRRYLSMRPAQVQAKISGLNDKLGAYSTCKVLVEDAMNDLDSHQQKVDRIKTKIEDGSISDTREVGERPEKLRDVRNVMAEIEAEKSAE